MAFLYTHKSFIVNICAETGVVRGVSPPLVFARWGFSLPGQEVKKVEDKLLLCSCCHGLLRDACICVEEFRCRVCIPEGVAWQPVKMNREIVNEKMVICLLLHLVNCVYYLLFVCRFIVL